MRLHGKSSNIFITIFIADLLPDVLRDVLRCLILYNNRPTAGGSSTRCLSVCLVFEKWNVSTATQYTLSPFMASCLFPNRPKWFPRKVPVCPGTADVRPRPRVLNCCPRNKSVMRSSLSTSGGNAHRNGISEAPIREIFPQGSGKVTPNDFMPLQHNTRVLLAYLSTLPAVLPYTGWRNRPI